MGIFSSVKSAVLFLIAFAVLSILVGFVKGAIQQHRENKQQREEDEAQAAAIRQAEEEKAARKQQEKEKKSKKNKKNQKPKPKRLSPVHQERPPQAGTEEQK